jgi:hypothetical protein
MPSRDEARPCFGRNADLGLSSYAIGKIARQTGASRVIYTFASAVHRSEISAPPVPNVTIRWPVDTCEHGSENEGNEGSENEVETLQGHTVRQNSALHSQSSNCMTVLASIGYTLICYCLTSCEGANLGSRDP